jgi:undecaprenyl-diphosphatase
VAIDDSVLQFLADHRVALVDRAAQATMSAGTNRYLILVEACVVAVVIVKLHLGRLAVFALIAVATSTLVAGVMKAAIERPRPSRALALVHPAGSAMPSTNTAQVAALAVVVGWLMARRWPSHARLIAVGCVAAVLWVGFCVVYLGAHWPSDVIVGAVVGGAVGIAVLMADARLNPSVHR